MSMMILNARAKHEIVRELLSIPSGTNFIIFITVSKIDLPTIIFLH